MKKLINLRGPSGSGKTEAVRQFLGLHKPEVLEAKLSLCTVKITRLKDASVAVLGAYNANKCGGADMYKHGKQDIAEAVIWIALNLSPDAIIYEHLISSQTKKGTVEIAQGARMFGYEYRGILLAPSLETCKERILARSGARATYKKLDRMRDAAISVAKGLSEDGYCMSQVDTGGLSLEEMGMIVENAVFKQV